MKKSLLISGLIGVIALTSCSSNLNTDNKTSIKETTSVLTTTVTTTTASTITSTDSIETTTTSKEKTDEEKREEVINKAESAIESLSDNNFTAKIGNNVYLIDGNNCIKNNIIYEKNTDNYNVYTLIDEEEQSYTKEETTDYSFAEISLGRWNNIFTITDEIMLNRVTTESAYVVKKGFSVPEYEISYTTNGFIFSNENDSIEFYDIGKTEVNIPTNIAKEEEYVIKDGKYNLTNLKAALSDWMNGNNAEEKNISYVQCYRNLVDIKLINVTDEGLAFYTTTVAKSNKEVLTYFRFNTDDINSTMDDDNVKYDDFVSVLYTTKAADILCDNIIEIDNSSSSSIVRRANWVLENDNVDAEVIWAYENTGKSTLAGNGYGYSMVCFATDGKYYEYAVNCTDKASDKDDYTGRKTNEISVLTENLELYGFDNLNDDKDQYIIKDGKYNLTNLKTVLEKWFNETDIIYQKIGAHVEKVLLLDVNDKGLDIYTITNIDDGSCPVISNVSFKGEDINNIFLSKEDITSKDFVDLISSVTAKQITVHDGITIDNSDTKESVCRRAENVLVKDEIDAKVIWAFETEKISTDLTYGNGLTYKMACFCEDGNYYEYAVNTLGKSYVENNITNKFDVEQEAKVSALLENLELYGFDILNADKDQYIIKDGKYNLTNLKAALTDWMNGNNAEEKNIPYAKFYRYLVEIKLINVTDEGLAFYATTVSKSNTEVLHYFRFKIDDVNSIVNDDNVDAEVVWAYENTGKSTLAGNGYGYNMVCFATDGKYYEYAVNCTDKASDKDDYTGTKTNEVSVLEENFDLYEEK